MNRRKFISNVSYTAALGYLNTLPLSVLWEDESIFHLTIMHTNDVHSRIEPFPMDGSRNAGQGGVAKRKILIDKIRNENPNNLLLDAGDIFQGTPYFNLYGGELEIKLMSELGYDVGTIGNHDFDGGLEGLVKQLTHADFRLVNSNYDVSNTALHDKVDKYKIWKFEDVTIGLYGLGIKLHSLVPKNLYLETEYLDPIQIALEQERFLKNEMKCDYVICLSHLGYRYREQKVSDVVIAQSTFDTDLIIGGHTHTFMKEPRVEKNKNDEPVIINQAGWAGILLGRIDLFLKEGAVEKPRKEVIFL